MESVSALLAICAGNSPVPGEFPAQRPVTRGFDVFFDLRPCKQLSKQSWGWWFETPSHSLWRHRNDIWSKSKCPDFPHPVWLWSSETATWKALFGLKHITNHSSWALSQPWKLIMQHAIQCAGTNLYIGWQFVTYLWRMTFKNITT